MENLKTVIEKNDFLLPNYRNEVSIVDLMRTLYCRYGVDFKINDKIKELDKIIPKKKHTLFVLSDGTGSNLIEKLPDDAILKKNKKKDLLTVFPSTTGCVLTSLVTGAFPEEHGIWGWFNYNRKLNRDYYSILFADRKTEKSLIEFGINSDDIFKTKSVLPKLNVKLNVLFPNYINDSVYSNFVAPDTNRIPYENDDDIIKLIKKMCSSNELTYTYLYLPDIDNLEHDNGPYSDIVINRLKEINNMIKKISKNEDLTIVFTADHGQTDINKDIVFDFKKYDKYFYAYPGIDYGTATYYVKDEYRKEFEDEFKNDYGDLMFLFNTNEFLDNKIFGLGSISEYAKSNLGEYISLCKKGSYLINSENVEEFYGKIKGNHSGLTSDEMVIPLIVI